MEDWHKVIETASESLVKSPGSADLLLKRARAYNHTAQLQLALKDAECAVRVSRGAQRAQAQVERARALNGLGKVSQALRVLEFAEGPDVAALRDDILKANAGVEPDNATEEVTQAVRYDWYDTPSSVALEVFAKNVQDTAAIMISENSVTVVDDDLIFSIDVGPIDAPHSLFQKTPNKIEFKLVKKTPEKWPSLLGPNIAEPPLQAKTQIPTSAPNAKDVLMPFEKKWDVDDSDEDKDTGDPQDFFRKLYANADDDTRRAMMKSYVESNGTALSTNWDEIKKSPVPTQPPKSMEARKW